MSIRTDVTINWELSPRLIEIAEGSIELTAQDSADTLRSLEHIPNPGFDVFSHDYILEAAGKDDLGGGTSVGITLTYQDGQVAFARTGSRGTGTVTTGSTTQLIDSAADFVTDGVQRGDWVINFTDQSVTEVLSVVDLNTLNVRLLTDGTDNDFDIGDTYKVWEVAECDLSGGNQLAVDTVGSTISPLFTTFGRFAIKTASSSATLQNQEQLEAATFIGKDGLGISIASITGTDSATYPIGIEESPCKTETNLHAIYDVRGYRKVYAKESITLIADHSAEKHIWYGDNPQTVTITLDNACDVTDNKFQDLTVTGKLDSGNELRECIVGSLTNANGFIYNSTIQGPIVASGNLNLQGCWVAPGVTDSEFIIDFNSQTIACEVTGFHGGRILVKNMVTGSTFFMASEGGKVTFDSTCTGGTVAVFGGVEISNSGTFDDFDDDTTFTRLNDMYEFDGLNASNTVALTGDGVTSSVATVNGKVKTVTPSSITRT